MSEIIEGMSYEDYAARPGVNASLLKIVDQYSLAHARAYMDGTFKPESDALDFGKAFHSHMLEGKTEYVITPETYPHSGDKAKGIEKGDPAPWNSNAKFCKQWAESQTQTILTAVQHEKLLAMSAAGQSLLPVARRRHEVSVFAEKDGIPIKCRIDMLPEDVLKYGVWDVKSCVSANPENFLSRSLSMRYHMQAAWTLDVLRLAGVKADIFNFEAIEKTAPYAVSVLTMADIPCSFLRVGRARCRAAFQKLRTAQETGKWPGYGVVTAEDFAKPWQLKELEQTA